MAISHTNCDHPSTSAARTKCRREQGVTSTPSGERILAEKAGLVTPKKVRKPRDRPRRMKQQTRVWNADTSECFLIDSDQYGQMARCFTHHTVPNTWLENMPSNFSTAVKRFMAFGWPVTWGPPIPGLLRCVSDPKTMQSVTVNGPHGFISLEWNVDDFEDRTVSAHPYGRKDEVVVERIKDAVRVVRSGIWAG